jgi:hypothetical protein
MRLILLAALVAAACGGSNDLPEVQADAEQKCQAFEDAVCSRQWDCSNQQQDRTAVLARCRTSLATMLDCRQVKHVTTSYDRCLQELGAASCQALTSPTDPRTLQPPASCDHIVIDY